MICFPGDPEDKCATLKSLGFVKERQIRTGDGVCCGIWGGVGTGVLGYILYKELDLFEVSEPVRQVERVSCYFSPPN
jgi:hypothetical protein